MYIWDNKFFEVQKIIDKNINNIMDFLKLCYSYNIIRS